jgi:ferredoxin
MVTVRIKWEACTLCYMCVETCPEFFEIGTDEEPPRVVKDYRTGGKLHEGEAPTKLKACVTEAAGECPAEAISLG